jgi:hypothetical protein
LRNPAFPTFPLLLSLQIMSRYGKLLEYLKEHHIKEDTKQHLGQKEPGCFLLRPPSRSVSIDNPESNVVLPQVLLKLRAGIISGSL